MNKIGPRGFLQWVSIALLGIAAASAQAEKLVEINKKDPILLSDYTDQDRKERAEFRRDFEFHHDCCDLRWIQVNPTYLADYSRKRLSDDPNLRNVQCLVKAWAFTFRGVQTDR